MISPELQLVLQSYLIRHAEEWQKYVAEYSELANSSVHIAPDMCYVAVEHEEWDTKGHECFDAPLVRRSPACIEVLCKL